MIVWNGQLTANSLVLGRVQFSTKVKKADFFIIGSGKLTTVKSFAKMCIDYLGLDYSNYIVIDKKLIRPSKTSFLKANTAKAKKTFNFKIKTDIKKLVKIMMDSELEKYK